jgi:hypothetical protein
MLVSSSALSAEIGERRSALTLLLAFSRLITQRSQFHPRAVLGFTKSHRKLSQKILAIVRDEAVSDNGVEKALNSVVEIQPSRRADSDCCLKRTLYLPQPALLKKEQSISLLLPSCPSSNGLRQSELFRDGGSGSFGFEIRLLSTDVAIVAV